ncbi:Oxidized polyvinyl alcohol hydrolase precursor [Caulifigura coniformis]|uniref:Oxidized polyvinyl alcohol hydrolase n=1 Tax=Caulifigura coniformis TaxID=2527983 RepID=A0A517SHC2_9PLAN|nr:PHB depolymerase family esterase [Caulifigura coniformis]QDT55524.1 Oxidized polyvinyl alcohol hydrolase precursor [Caulifigura coniformis]
MTSLPIAVLLGALVAAPLGPGDHARKLSVDGRERSYLVHVPEAYSRERATPVVLVLHGARTNGLITIAVTGMNAKSDQAGFIAVYPNGTGSDPFLYWNAGQRSSQIVRENPDDVKFIRLLLDDLGAVLNVDQKRVFAAGMSNGGMMCYRLAAELSDRIAAIAPVAGTMAIPTARPGRPVSVLHFHGTADNVVQYNGRNSGALQPLKSVSDSIEYWRIVNGCAAKPVVSDLPDRDRSDGTTVRRTQYPPGNDAAEVVLYAVQNGGHTWPGQKSLLPTLGKSTLDISANDLMWEFFERHSMK